MMIMIIKVKGRHGKGGHRTILAVAYQQFQSIGTTSIASEQSAFPLTLRLSRYNLLFRNRKIPLFWYKEVFTSLPQVSFLSSSSS